MLKVKELKPKHIFYPHVIEMEHLEDVEMMERIVDSYYLNHITMPSDGTSSLRQELQRIISRYK
ncbi:hypothetical protein LCGC14_0720580 [marine sediment metagenome]|uniref:Uncharacterized protein n=1 Tax=marine sediment metagenome TaxID=412755 RepID=A0A0F9TJV5_9ZZZZ